MKGCLARAVIFLPYNKYEISRFFVLMAWLETNSQWQFHFSSGRAFDVIDYENPNRRLKFNTAISTKRRHFSY